MAKKKFMDYVRDNLYFRTFFIGGFSFTIALTIFIVLGSLNFAVFFGLFAFGFLWFEARFRDWGSW